MKTDEKPSPIIAHAILDTELRKYIKKLPDCNRDLIGHNDNQLCEVIRNNEKLNMIFSIAYRSSFFNVVALARVHFVCTDKQIEYLRDFDPSKVDWSVLNE